MSQIVYRDIVKDSGNDAVIYALHYVNEEMKIDGYYKKARAYIGTISRVTIEEKDGYTVTTGHPFDDRVCRLKVLEKGERRSKKLDSEMIEVFKGLI